MNISAEGKIDLSDCRYIPESAGDRRLQYDDILFNNTNSPVWVGKTAWVGTNAQGLAYSNHMTRLTVSSAAISPFIARQLDWLRMSGYFELNCNKHVNQASISGDFLRYRTPVLLPPLPEQKRIADKLDALLGRVDACRARLDRVPALLKRFRQSVLAAATSGRLTAEWRMTNGVNDEWEDTQIQSVAAVGTGTTPLRSNSSFYSTNGTPWVTSAATSQTLVTRTEEFVTDAAIKAHRLKKYPIGTLLVAMYGEGKTRGQVTELGIEATVNQACAAISVDESIVSKRYVKFSLEANYLEMRELAEGGNQPNLNLSKIKEFPIKLPTPAEQQEIVCRVEALFSLADRIEARLATAQKTVERLTPATLAKAFRGELVPQDPNDEPAAALLERIITTARNRPLQVAKKSGARRNPNKSESMDDLRTQIIKMPRKTFTFDELRNAVSAPYEELQKAVFELLAEKPRRVSQEFDKKAKCMKFRVHKP